MPTYRGVQIDYGATTTTEGQARTHILMSGPPKSKEEKKLERLRMEAERKR